MKIRNTAISDAVNKSIVREEVKTHITHGDYFRFCPSSETSLHKIFQENAIYIVISLSYHHITQELHNLTLFIPRHEPSGEREIKLSYKEFEPHFVFVEPTQAEAERKALLSQLENQTVAIQQELQRSLADPESIFQLVMTSENEEVQTALAEVDRSISLLPSPEQRNANSTSIVPLSKGQSIDVVKRQLLNQKQLGEVVTTYAKVKGEELSSSVSNVASVMQEKAKAVIGQANAMKESIGDVLNKVEILDLYLGEKVDVITIVDKPESNTGEPIAFFSNKIYVDEEIATHHIFSKGQFDAYEINKFFDALRDDDTLRDRILPNERSVVCFQARRTARQYHSNPFVNAHLNIPNFSVALLVRDGERITCINSPIDYQARLFPTQNELDSYMTSVASVDDTRLTDSQRRLKYLNDTYTKVAAILQGIIDRQESGGEIVFGSLPASQFGGSFFNPDLIRQNVQFINDEDYLIGQHDVIERARDWLRQHQTDLHREGDFIAFNSDTINSNNARSLFEFSNSEYHDREPEQVYNTPWPVKVLQVATYRSNIAVKIDVNYVGYQSSKSRSKQSWVTLTPEINQAQFNLMAMRLSELELLMQSRVARQTIMHDMRELIECRCFLKKLDADSQALQSLMAKHPTLKELNRDERLLLLLAWLANTKNKPSLISEGSPRVLKALAAIHDAKVTLSSDDYSSIYQACQDAGITPLLVATNNTNAIVVSPSTNLDGLPYTPSHYMPKMANRLPMAEICKVYEWRHGTLVAGGYLTDHMNKHAIKHIYSTPYMDAITDEELTEFVKNNSHYRELDRDEAKAKARESIESHYKQDTRTMYSATSFAPYYKHISALKELQVNTEFSRRLESIQSALRSSDINQKLTAINMLIEQINNDEHYIDWKDRYTNEKSKSVALPIRIWVTGLETRRNTYNNRKHHLTWKGVAFSPLSAIATLYRSMSKLERFEYQHHIESVIRETIFCKKDYAANFLSSENTYTLHLVTGYVENGAPCKVESSNHPDINESHNANIEQWLIDHGLPTSLSALFEGSK
ncbi:hypothetical protein QTV44_002506 [Vibrio vulnificus]|nr:hypothetical protein [Vibrio vulnificus]